MKTKDFVNIGAFTAIYFVLVFATGMLGVINPLMMFVGYLLGITANSAVIGLFKARVPATGALTIMGLLVGGLMVLTGHPWIVVILTPLLGFAGEFIMARGGFSRLANSLGYAVLTIWYIVPWFPVFINADSYREYIVSSMGDAYAAKLDWFLSPLPIVCWGLFAFVAAFLAAFFFGQKLVTRHFAKAGIAK